MEMVEAALPDVDVLSFQDFREPVNHLADWHQKTGKPVLLADAAKMNLAGFNHYRLARVATLPILSRPQRYAPSQSMTGAGHGPAESMSPLP